MVNPIIQSGRNIIIYFALWTLFAAIYCLISLYNFPISLASAIKDAVVVNLLMAVLGIGLWYVVRYNDVRERDAINLALTHIVISVVVVAIWYFLSMAILQLINQNDAAYLAVLDKFKLWIFIGGFGYYLIIILIFYAVNFYNTLTEKEVQQAQLQAYLREAELRSLKSQLNPHFIFNSLNSINALTLDAPAKAREMVVKLSEFLRYSLKKDGQAEMTPFKEELENIQRYMDIEKVRFGDRLSYEARVPEECLEKKIPIYLLQPVIENAIKHGVYGSMESVFIRLKCRMNDNVMTLNISNNYEKESFAPKKSAGIGLKNIQNRLKIIYGDENLIRIKDDGKLFQVALTIP